jgi:16S rRNA (cytidine1402-2'-O)-methyltransferase
MPVPAQPEAPPGGTLYVVATPIGNLEDVTLRAVRILGEVPLAAAEDTRITRRLLARCGLTTRLVSYHARNAAAREVELLAHLRGGADLALLTDAGTPLVSDPGEGLVAAWAAEGGRVVPLPGPSAVLAALVVSGLPTARWSFEGFLPRSGRARRERVARIAADPRPTVLFEAPGRTAATLRDLAGAAGTARAAVLCRELTKRHESIWRGTLGELAARAAEEAPRGEVTMVVAGATRGATASAGTADAGAPISAEVPGAAGLGGERADLTAARREVRRLVAEGASRSAAARRVAAATGLPRRVLYAEDRHGS